MTSHLSQEVKEVVLRVLEFCKEEKYNRRPIIPLKKVHLRVATATGVSMHTVTNIVREGKIAALNGTKIGGEKKRKPRSDKITFSKFDIELVKDLILDHFNEHNEYPSLKKLLPLVRKQIGYTNSMETFRKILRKMGIIYEKTENNKWVLQQDSSSSIDSVDFIQMDYEKLEKYINHDHDYIKS